jgi:16S rRNA processing protein RimM
MGRVAGAFGVRGWVRVQPYTESIDGLAAYPHWWIGPAGQAEAFELSECAAHGDALVAKLEGIDDREAAAALKGRAVAVPRTAFPPAGEGEVYWADLIGLKVVNLQGDELGEVAEVFSNGAQAVLRVARGDEERLIPFVDAAVQRLDLPAQRIEVDWGADW